MRKTIIATLGALALGGCAVVTSDAPLFTAADAVGGAVLRPGVWAMPSEADCAFDQKAPRKDWPKCANATIVRPATFSNGANDGPDGKDQTLNYLLTGGEPPVLQIMRPDSEKDGPPVIYAGLRVTTFDDQHRATALRIWLALCAKPATSGGNLSPGPTTLLPGLTLRPGGGQECYAKAKGPVRNAVKQSEIWIAGGGDKDLTLQAHWVRDGEE